MPHTIPAMAAESSFPVTMVIRLTGMVNNVSRVLFSFSLPMELMTMLPTIIMMTMMTMGTTML